MPNNEVVRLPMPAQLTPPHVKSALMTSVRLHFYKVYNGPNGDTFRDHLASVDNASSITKNRSFDRCKAMEMLKEAAMAAHDREASAAPEGKVWQCVCHIIARHHPELRLKDRRRHYAQLTRAAATRPAAAPV